MESQRNASSSRHAADVKAEKDEKARKKVQVPSVRDLTALRTELDSRHEHTIERVGALVREQRSLTTAIADDISALRKDGDTLQQLEKVEQEETGILNSLARRLGRRGRMLERRTVAVRLQEQYTHVHTTLRKASAFADELRLCAAELAQEVDRLHADVEESLAASVDAEARVAEIEAELAELVAANNPSDLRHIDRLTFERSDLQTAASLHEAKARLCSQEVEPARKLRETVHALHQEMAHYVLNASSSIEGSGRRIQALGLAADAPVVISELQAGLDQLDLAMTATEAYLDQAHDMLTRVLPELSEHIRVQGDRAALDLETGLAAIRDAKSAHATDTDLRAAALAEVELLGVDLGPSASE